MGTILKEGRARVDALTTLRFIAAFLVVVYHFGPSAGIPVASGMGPLMVTFFFVLSGFVLTIAYMKGHMFKPGPFLINRLSRVCPAFYAALLLELFSRWLYGRPIDFSAVGLNLALAQAWVPGQVMILNPPGWSLSVELFLYISFPLIIAAIFAARVSMKNIFMLTGVAWLATQVVSTVIIASELPLITAHDLVSYFPPMHLCSFICGISCGVYFLGTLEYENSPSRLAAAALISAALVVLGSWKSNWISQLFPFPLVVETSLLAPLFAVMIFSVAKLPKAWRYPLEKPSFVFLGEISFALYIFQVPVHWLYERWMGAALSDIPIARLVLFVTVLLLVSAGSFVCLEKPAMRFIRRLYSGRSVSAYHV
ncbi:acyltransferase [Thermomonas sp.]|uniref:acyltransferase family protein n=1 Tax=Thermomonas sp. TaxID=1971895 RepID=UPI0024898E63|nr:acyltransferase [Thermomonas sp.]MDI1253520.1 acyltransferase [Thermomonas sp.]